MRKLVVGLVLATLLTLATVVPASAHVHAITPLNSCTVDRVDKSGGRGANGTPPQALNGPITGVIPRDTGNAPLTFGDGGKFAPVQCP